MKFTRTQWEIIEHRLEVPDAIIEVLTDTDASITVHDIWGAIDIVEFKKYLINPKPLELVVIKECCNGSTFFCDIDDAVARGEITPQQRRSWHGAANQLEYKLEVVIPRG